MTTTESDKKQRSTINVHGNIDIDALEVPDWFKSGLKKLDLDGDGLEESEVSEMLARVAEEKRRAKYNVDEIHYNHMPPKVQEVMRSWDHDLSGSVSVVELTAAAKAQAKLQQENRVVKRLLFAAVLMIILLGVLNFVMSLLAVEQGKDFKPRDTSSGRRLASGGTAAQGALADSSGVLMGTTTPKDKFTDIASFHDQKPSKSTLEGIQAYSIYDPNTGGMQDHPVNSASFVGGDLHLKTPSGLEYTIQGDGTVIEAKPDGAARVVPPEKPNSLITSRDAGMQELTMESPPTEPPLPEGGPVPLIFDHCPLQSGKPMCDVAGLKTFVTTMFASGDKGGVVGPEPTAAEVEAFFASADCNNDGLVSPEDIHLAENGIPCPQHRRRLRQVHPAQRPARVRRVQAERRRLMAAGNITAAGPPDNCIPTTENAHMILANNPTTAALPRKHRGPAMANLQALDSNKDGCVDDKEQEALTQDHLDGAKPIDCSKIKPPRSCRCLPEGVDSIRKENEQNLLPQCQGKFDLLDADSNGEVTRKECDEGSASKAADDFFKMMHHAGTCPQQTGYISREEFIDFAVGEKGQDPIQAEIYAMVADMDDDGMMDMVEAVSSPDSILNDFHGDYTNLYNATLGARALRRLTSTTGSKRRLHFIQRLMEPRVAQRAHHREQRRLRRELTIRGRMLERVGDAKYGRWLEERRDVGNTRRRLVERRASGILKEDAAAMSTEDLTGQITGWEESSRYRALEAQYSERLPTSSRRLLGLRDSGRRRLAGNLTDEELTFQTELAATFPGIPPASIEMFVEENVDKIWDAEAVTRYQACPTPFYAHLHEDYEVDDYNTAHAYPTDTDILVDGGAVDAVAATLGVSPEQARYKIEHLYGPSGSEGDQRRRQRLRRLSERDPLHRRRLGEFDIDPLADEMPVPSLDQCEFLRLTDPVQYDLLMSTESAQVAYHDGVANYCLVDQITANPTDTCAMPTNAYMDPSTHEVTRDDTATAISPIQFAASQTQKDPACKNLPWQETIMPTKMDAAGNPIADTTSTYAKNWDHQIPGKGCELTCCTTGNKDDCAGDKLIKNCPCLREKKRCMKVITDKIITSSTTGTGASRRRMRRLQRRLARKHVIGERRRMRRLEKLLPFERRRLMAQDRATRMERRRLQTFDEMKNPDGTHNFCSGYDGSYENCNWEFGCTYLNSTNTCVSCSGATAVADCTGSCVFSGGVCGIPDECTGVAEADCNMPGCGFVSGTCQQCQQITPGMCPSPGCRLSGGPAHVCIANDYETDGPGGSEFHDDCPLRVTSLDAMCAVDSSLPCTSGIPPTDATVQQHYDALSAEQKYMIPTMTTPGLSYDARDTIVEHLTMEEHPIDYTDIESLQTRRLQSTDGTIELGAIGTAVYSNQENAFSYISTSQSSVTSTEVHDFLELCKAQEQESPSNGEAGQSFCEDVERLDSAMSRGFGNDEYEVSIHECHELTENTLAEHLTDIGPDQGIDRPTYTCMCTQMHHMSSEECGAHYDQTAANPAKGMTWEESHHPPPAIMARTRSEEQPYTPDMGKNLAEEYAMYEQHDYALDKIRMIAESIFWEIFGAAQTNNIRRRRLAIAESELEPMFENENDDFVPACDPAQISQVTLSTFEFLVSQFQELRYCGTELLHTYEDTDADMYADIQAKIASLDAALASLNALMAPGTLDYWTLYNMPTEVMDFVCVTLLPGNIPYRPHNVVTYQPEIFDDDQDMYANDMQWQDEDEYEWDATPPPAVGQPISLEELNPLPPPALEFPTMDGCKDGTCYWQDEPAFLFTETNTNDGTSRGKAIQWDPTKVSADTHHVDHAASRLMETHSYPWEFTQDEFVAGFQTVVDKALQPTTIAAHEAEMETLNAGSDNSHFAAGLAKHDVETRISGSEFEQLFETLKPDGLDALPRPIDPEDVRSPAEACKEYLGVASGLEEWVLDATGAATATQPLELYEKCVQHRAQQRGAECVKDVKESIANERATATVVARVRRRLAAVHGGEENFPSHVRRLFAEPEHMVNPMTMMRKHKVHRKRTLRAHGRRLRVQENRRARALRRRLETGDDTIEIPTVGHDLAPSVIDRMLQATGADTTAALANAGVAELQAEFEIEVRKERALLKGAVVFQQLPLDDFDITLECMHDYVSQTVPYDAAPSHNMYPCAHFAPASPPLVGGVVALAAADQTLFDRCAEPFHSLVPEEAQYFASHLARGEIPPSDFLAEAFPGEMPTAAAITEVNTQATLILHNTAQFDNKCYCQCKENAMYGKTLDIECSRFPTINGVVASKNVCQIIREAKMHDKQKDCLPAALTRRLQSVTKSCITLNGEEYCKEGSPPLRQLSTRRRPGRKLQAMRKSVSRHLSKPRKLSAKVRRKLNRAFRKKNRRRV